MAVLTGAGISAESGVPTFRQAQTGLWARYDPQQLATPQAFRRQPQLVWDWYAWRRTLVAAAEPNPGHFALVEMERRAPHFTLITQNVDSLHRRAGSRAVLELHGNIARTKCSREGRVIETWPETDARPPRCPDCGAFLAARRSSGSARRCPPTRWTPPSPPPAPPRCSYPSARRAWFIRRPGCRSWPGEHGALTVEINPEATPLSDDMSYCLRGPAGVALPALVAAVWL